MNHGIAKVKKDIGNIPKGTMGVITAYLPRMDRIAVMWANTPGASPAEHWITFDKESFKEYCEIVELVEGLEKYE